MLRPWDFKIVIRRGSKAAVFLQIAHAIIDEIKRGRLAPGTALPGSRELAESLDINRKTVIQAYAELEAQGWVTTEKTRGTFVSAHLPQVGRGAREQRRGQIPERPDFRLVGTAPNIPLILPEKNMLVFDDGAPDTRQIPVDALARAYRDALTRRIRRGLGYGDPRGSEELRAAISNLPDPRQPDGDLSGGAHPGRSGRHGGDGGIELSAGARSLPPGRSRSRTGG